MVSTINLTKTNRLGSIKNELERDDYEPLGKLGNLDIYYAKDSTVMGVIGGAGRDMVFHITFSRSFKRRAWHVDLTEVDSKYQGFGAMPRVYHFLLANIPGFIMEAGGSQSPGGQSIWKRLATYPDVVVFTYDRGRIVELEYDETTDELSSDEYDQIVDADRDFRVFAAHHDTVLR
jgi:hypothetical protein